ncbi:hypothetical protein I7I50_03505 [Histoplasma capsulatum G186AR]|nr:hypothetical protein I7I52_04412 [Histoplasma capsulatum]QSS74633.1 hypothetical protein I7I50_03505 [Histoplasma capsulatum G186AR]
MSNKMSRAKTTATIGIVSSKCSKPPRFVPPRQRYFAVRYTPENTPTLRAKRFSNDSHINLYALRPKIEYMWAMREKGCLWWSASTHGDITSERSVIRSWCARRVRTAFRDALKERGYDKTGRRIQAIKQHEQQIQDGRPLSQLEALKGTLEINFRLAVKAAEYTDIVREAGILIDGIEAYLQKIGGSEGNAKNPGDVAERSKDGMSPS